LNTFGWLQRHPWRVVAAFLLLGALAAGGYAALFYYHLRAATDANARYDFDEAQDHLATCIRLWPRRADLHLEAARTARRAGRFAEATEHLDECQRLEGRTDENLLEYALLRAQQGDFRDSGSYLLGVLKRDPPEAALILEALALGTNHVYLLGESMDFAEGVLRREPGNVPMLLLHAHLWDVVSHFDDAEKDYRAAVEAQPRHGQARLELAQFLFRRDKIEEAIDHFEELRKRHLRPQEVLLGLAFCRRQQGRTAEERQLLDALLDTWPDDAGALTERGRLELDADELEAAERDLRNAVSKVPYDHVANFHLARCLDRLGKDEESQSVAADMQRIEADLIKLGDLVAEIAKNPNDVEKHLQAGQICLRNGRNQEAERWFLGAWEIDPQQKATNKALADFYNRMDRADLAAPYRNAAR
jgi:tetratricopeptide (TPR) repeat protein